MVRALVDVSRTPPPPGATPTTPDSRLHLTATFQAQLWAQFRPPSSTAQAFSTSRVGVSPHGPSLAGHPKKRVGTPPRGGHVAEVIRGTAQLPPTRATQRGGRRRYSCRRFGSRRRSLAATPARVRLPRQPRPHGLQATPCQRSAPVATARAPSLARTTDAGSMGVGATRLRGFYRVCRSSSAESTLVGAPPRRWARGPLAFPTTTLYSLLPPSVL